jgi:hypothetical protein
MWLEKCSYQIVNKILKEAADLQNYRQVLRKTKKYLGFIWVSFRSPA